ncbi:cytochrome c, class I [Sulfurihydrogenibium azorense Az-Fu1]|jgi:cytochrome c551/c552|uniref:Cytochrome c, class I n=1 Tax=Sulfurihydrogenibium azorense (strain DSM 15241 / OCM 825 / Az-Fu1) TaxID=204536 RepID=C1DWR2_SULAA|nr:c-type cytochrome [Sulfurihydrogenibium azorense]ACN99556.1 cytochrome c, class I [Sulfurihydrogenibium azorense Az-Fu1]MDM7273226.1 c-type cytochrome [Sulfurihydrogenibium azorense]
MKVLYGFILIFVYIFVIYANEGKDLYIKHGCNACHDPFERKTGPSFKEISQRYGTSKSAVEKVAKLIIKPNPSNWPGFAYMPPYNIPYQDALKLAEYVLIHSQKEEQKKKIYKDLSPDSSEFY